MQDLWSENGTAPVTKHRYPALQVLFNFRPHLVCNVKYDSFLHEHVKWWMCWDGMLASYQHWSLEKCVCVCVCVCAAIIRFDSMVLLWLVSAGFLLPPRTSLSPKHMHTLVKTPKINDYVLAEALKSHPVGGLMSNYQKKYSQKLYEYSTKCESVNIASVWFCWVYVHWKP